MSRGWSESVEVELELEGVESGSVLKKIIVFLAPSPLRNLGRVRPRGGQSPAGENFENTVILEPIYLEKRAM